MKEKKYDLKDGASEVYKILFLALVQNGGSAKRQNEQFRRSLNSAGLPEEKICQKLIKFEVKDYPKSFIDKIDETFLNVRKHSKISLPNSILKLPSNIRREELVEDLKRTLGYLE